MAASTAASRQRAKTVARHRRATAMETLCELAKNTGSAGHLRVLRSFPKLHRTIRRRYAPLVRRGLLSSRESDFQGGSTIWRLTVKGQRAVERACGLDEGD